MTMTCRSWTQAWTTPPLPKMSSYGSDCFAQQEENDLETEEAETTTIVNLADNYLIGTTINNSKDDSTFRLFCCNPNGFRLNSKGGEFAEMLEESKNLSADVMCFYKHNLDTTIWYQ